MTPANTRLVPTMADSSGDLPFLYSCAMLSESTIASSIKIPIAISKAIIDIMLMVTPNITIIAMPPRNEMGNPKATQNV